MKQIFYIWLLLWSFVSSSAIAQTTSNCNPLQVYTPKHDGTGTLPYTGNALGALELVAKELAKTFPEPFCANFKVYDYGFTPTHQYTKGGYAEDFEVMKLEALGTNRDGYYLLFAREVDQMNRVTKIWVDVNLPKEGSFKEPCFIQKQRELVRIRIEAVVNARFSDDNHDVHTAEMQGIIAMTKQVKKILNCCYSRERGGDDSCTNDCKEDIELLLNAAKFIRLPLNVVNKLGLKQSSDRSSGIVNKSKLSLEGRDIEAISNEIISSLASEGTTKIYITDDDFYCDDIAGFDAITSDYWNDDSNFLIWFHLKRFKDNEKKGVLYVKTNFDFELPYVSDEYLAGIDNFKELMKKPRKDEFPIRNRDMKTGWHLLPSGGIFLANNGTANDKNRVDGWKYDLNSKELLGYIPDVINNPTISSSFTPGGNIQDKNVKAVVLRRNSKCEVEAYAIQWNTDIDYKYYHTCKNEAHREFIGDNIEIKTQECCTKLLLKQPILSSQEPVIKKLCSEDLNDVADWQKMQEALKTMVDKDPNQPPTTYFKHISANDAHTVTYISRDGPKKADQSNPIEQNFNIFEIEENGSGKFKVKIRFRNACPSCHTTADKVLEKAIEAASKRQGDNSGKLIDPSKPIIDHKVADEILKNNGGKADAGVQKMPNGKTGILTQLGEKDANGNSEGIQYDETKTFDYLAAIAKSYNDLVNNLKIPDDVWQKDKTFPIRDKLYFPSGAGNTVIEETKDLAGLIGMGMTMVSNPTQTYEDFKGYALAFKDDPWTKTKNFVVAAAKSTVQYDELTSGEKERVGYATGVVAVTAVKTVLGGAFISGMKNVPGALRKKIDNIADLIKKIRKELKDAHNWSDADLDKYADNVANLADENGLCGGGSCATKFGCLTGNTPVEVENGRFEPIASMQVGKCVNTYNHSTKRTECKPIKAVQKYLSNSLLVLTLSSGISIEATPNHPFYVKGIYQEAANLEVGDTLFTKNNEIITISNIFAKDTLVEVFNLVVADNDNYFASEAAVLNKKCPLDAIISRPTLKAKFDALDETLQHRFLTDFADADETFLDLLAGIKPPSTVPNPNSKAFDAWKKLSARPKWVSSNKKLLEKLDNEPQNIIDKVAEYYEKTIPSNTPSGFNGPGVYGQVEFNEFGHPKLLPHVSDPNHIVTINMKGNYTSDMTDAKNALIAQSFNGDASKIRKAIDPNTGKEASGWSPFQIQQADGSWSEPYTWHHHQNGSSMYPVKKTIHDSIAGKHTGGREIVTKYPDLIGFFNEQ